jgi:hypothetical protein
LKARYGFTDAGDPIAAPPGWRILPEGAEIPSVHRECREDGYWCYPRRCRSTMTALDARVWGWVRAYAVPLDKRLT